MINYIKFVDFQTYCKLCKHFDIKEIDDPCNECLANAVNNSSTKPVLFDPIKKETRKLHSIL